MVLIRLFPRLVAGRFLGAIVLVLLCLIGSAAALAIGLRLLALRSLGPRLLFASFRLAVGTARFFLLMLQDPLYPAAVVAAVGGHGLIVLREA